MGEKESKISLSEFPEEIFNIFADVWNVWIFMILVLLQRVIDN